jgi:hypothetical protein
MFVIEAVKEADQLMRVLRRGGIRERNRKGVRSPPASSGSNDGTPVYLSSELLPSELEVGFQPTFTVLLYRQCNVP